ncbi:MAG: hypothetical protein KBH01_02005 [Breznakibacter sp.]|nr:hypothetical protein [Breznakibacter sp.]
MRFYLILGVLILFSFATLGQSSHDVKVENYQKKWSKLIPSQLKGQFAGSMGMLSAGVGWDYGKRRQWETDFMMGFVPGNKYEDGHLTMTLKQTYTPFRIQLGHDFHFEPLTSALYVTKIYGEYFWSSLPEKYPKGYYFWAVNTRFNLALGQAITIPCNSKRFSRSISAFYEVNTNDLYLISAVGNESIKLKDIIGLSIGVRFRFFD